MATVVAVAPHEPPMVGVAGVIKGKLVLSQGLERTLDLAGNPKPEDMENLVADLRDACTRVGFFVIQNHGIEWSIVERAFAGLKEFFALPMETKKKVQSLSPSYMDLRESMTTSYEPELDPEGAGYQPDVLLRHNLWPDDADTPLFKPAMRKYRAACLSLMGLYYPPQAADDEESTGLGAHTDVQFMTMIAQDPFDVQSLEVLNASGHWIKPKLQPQIFVVNLGDMMARLTNDTYLSTIHRVRNLTGPERYSLPFFFGLNNDELISPLPKFITSESPVREGYETGLTSYEHYNRRMQRAHHKHFTATEKTNTALPKGMTKIDGVFVEGL
ncbi:hypothetical protein BJX76DRAFT_364737 [Aspergillus varians]